MAKKKSEKKVIETSNPGIVVKDAKSAEKIEELTAPQPVAFQGGITVRQERRVFGIEYGLIYREKTFFDRRKGRERVKTIRGLGCKRGDQTHYIPVFHSRDIPSLRQQLDELEGLLKADEEKRATERQKEAEEDK